MGLKGSKEERWELTDDRAYFVAIFNVSGLRKERRLLGKKKRFELGLHFN